MIEPTRVEPTQIELQQIKSMDVGPVPFELTSSRMSIRERLTRFSLFPQFEAAVLSQDPVAVVEVLLRAKLTLVEADLMAHAMCRDVPRSGMVVS